MFEHKGETDNIVKFSCFLCLPKKNVSPFASLPSNIRQHVEVRTESYPFFFFFILLHYRGLQAEPYRGITPGVRLQIWCDITRTIENVVCNTAVLNCSKDWVYFITIGKLFQILGVLMKNECLKSSVLADFNL